MISPLTWTLDLREHDPRDFFRVWKEKCLIGDDYSLQKENAPPLNESENSMKHSVVGSKVHPAGLKSFPVPASLAKRAPSQVLTSLLNTWLFNFSNSVVDMSMYSSSEYSSFCISTLTSFALFMLTFSPLSLLLSFIIPLTGFQRCLRRYPREGESWEGEESGGHEQTQSIRGAVQSLPLFKYVRPTYLHYKVH